MKLLRAALILVSGTLLLGQIPAPAALQKFWNAKSPTEAGKAISEIMKSGISFDDALRALKTGRSYAAQKSGIIMGTNRTDDGVEHRYAINVPANYDPAKRYQVRFQLHGGVGGRTTNEPRGNGAIGSLAGAEQFYVLPYAWDRAPWWGDDQVMNMDAIVDSLKRTYNIDENRVVVAGVSDGATGAYYIGMRDTTPFASFLPLNGYIMVLANEEIEDNRIFPNNLRNKPMFVVNGGLDRLYPTRTVGKYVEHLQESGVDIAYHPQENGEHNTAWWPTVKDVFEKFVTDNPREPHPDTITWETADSIHNRAHWLVIDKLGAQPDDVKSLPDANIMDRVAMFLRQKPVGRVDLNRNGNTIDIRSRGVAAVTLLVSPDAFDLSKPVKIVANGRTVSEGMIQPSLETLLKWAARDNDRTMLYAAELKVKLSR